MKKRITMKLFFVFFAVPAIVFAQSVSQISARIDSLESVKKDLEAKLNAVINEIDGLKKTIETLSTTMIHRMNKVFAKTTNPTFLYSQADPLSEKIIAIPQNSVLELLDYEDAHYKAIFKWQTGFVYEYYLVENDTLKFFKNYLIDKKSKTRVIEEGMRQQKQAEQGRALKIKQAKEEEIRKKAEADKAILRFQKLKATYGEETAVKIMQNKIWLGMSKDMAIESIGKPGQINRTVNAAVVREQWVYNSKKLYLYFENGFLVSWQD